MAQQSNMKRGNSVIDQFTSSLKHTISFYKERQQFQDLFRYIRKKAPSASAQENVTQLNTLLDFVLADFTKELRSKKLDVLPVSEFHGQLERKLLGVTLRGEFSGQNGVLKNISTLYRKENCGLVIPRSDSRIFTCTLSLRTAVVEFENYQLHWGPFNFRGRLSVEARDNAVCVKVALRLKENTQINRLEVTRAELIKCGKYHISVTGFGGLGGNRAAKAVIKLLLNKYKNDTKTEFEKMLRAYIRQTLVKFLA